MPFSHSPLYLHFKVSVLLLLMRRQNIKLGKIKESFVRIRLFLRVPFLAALPHRSFPIRSLEQPDEDKSLYWSTISMKLFVGNLSFQTTSEDLVSVFSPYGNVESVDVITDRMTGQSRGFGFVEISDRTNAQNAINALNGVELNGRAMNVNEARPRAERDFGRGKPRGGFGGQKSRREPRW